MEFTQQEKPAETKVDANLEPTAKITPEKSSDVREIAARIIYIMIFFGLSKFLYFVVFVGFDLFS